MKNKILSILFNLIEISLLSGAMFYEMNKNLFTIVLIVNYVTSFITLGMLGILMFGLSVGPNKLNPTDIEKMSTRKFEWWVTFPHWVVLGLIGYNGNFVSFGILLSAHLTNIFLNACVVEICKNIISKRSEK